MATKKNVQRPLGIGDTVVLNSGGPTMTINNVEATEPRSAHCVWFRSGDPMDGTFALATLKRRTHVEKKRPRPYSAY